MLRSLAALTVAASIALVACSDDGSTVRTPLPAHSGEASPTKASEDWPTNTFDKAAANTVVTVKEDEYSLAVSPASAKGRKIFFEVTNAGHENHEFEIVYGPDNTRVASIPTISPGETKTIAIEFPSGLYTLQCVVLKGVETHSMLGEKATFTVT
jgi:hypothetical protein